MKIEEARMADKIGNYLRGLDIDGNLDFEGYMNIIDWVMQKNTYIDELHDKDALQRAIRELFNRRIYIAHNYGLFEKNFYKYFSIAPSESEPTIKRYVYCIRALLSAQYCAEKNDIAPYDIHELIDATLKGKKKKEMEKLIALKMKTTEKKKHSSLVWDTFMALKRHSMPEVKEQDPAQHEAQHEELYRFLNEHLSETLGEFG